jgi:hypothetical protein
MLRGLTNRILKFWRAGDFCADLTETSRAADTVVQLHGRLREQLGPLHCRRLGAIFSQQLFLHSHKSFCLIVGVFVIVTGFPTS